MKFHATGKPRRNGGGWQLCNPKVWSFTTTCYANCGNCLRILRARGREEENTYLAHPEFWKRVRNHEVP